MEQKENVAYGSSERPIIPLESFQDHQQLRENMAYGVLDSSWQKQEQLQPCDVDIEELYVEADSNL